MLFFFSGLTALIYEVLWARMLQSLLGSTALAVSTVLVAYMSGLSLGGFLFGRIVDREGHRSLRTYAWLEAAIGLYALLMPWLLKAVDRMYITVYQGVSVDLSWFSLIGFFLSLAVLLPATILMGGTLPAMVRFMVPNETEFGRRVGLLYALNTCGAVIGCLAAGFFMIESWGLRSSNYGAAGLNLAIAGLAFALCLLDQRHQDVLMPEISILHTGQPGSRLLSSATLMLIALSGFISLAYEVLWTRGLVYFIGTPIYSFTTILASFLVGITLGSLMVTRFIKEQGDSPGILAIVEILIGLSVLALCGFFGRFSYLSDRVMDIFGRETWGQIVTTRFTLTLIAMFIPTVLIGMTVPLAGQIYAGATRRVGRGIGDVYGANTFGAVFGSFSAGFVLIPLLGVQRSLVVLSLGNVIIGCAFLLVSSEPRRVRSVAAVAGFSLITIAVLFTLPVLRPLILSSSTFQRPEFGYRLLGYKEGVGATVSAIQDKHGVRELNINGVSTAFTNSWDMRIHKLLAHLPLILHQNPRSVLVVGFGFGATASSVLSHENVERVEAVEISSAVVDMNIHFQRESRGVFANPRFHMIIDDGRHYVRVTNQRYDVISCNAIHPGTSAGNSNLYTTDFYRYCHEKLTDSGMMIQWLPLHQLSDEDLRMLIRSFQHVFSHTSIWLASGFALLVGTTEALAIDYIHFTQRLAEPAIAGDLAELGDLDSSNPHALLGYFLMAEDEVAAYCGLGALHTEDRPVIEYSAPRSSMNASKTHRQNLLGLSAHHQDVMHYLNNIPENERTKIETITRMKAKARQEIIAGIDAEYRGDGQTAFTHYRKALVLDPENVDAKYHLKHLFVSQAGIFQRAGMPDKAIRLLKGAVEIDPTFKTGYQHLGTVLYNSGLYMDAVEAIQCAAAIPPGLSNDYFSLAVAWNALGHETEAINALEAAVALNPDYWEAYYRLGMLRYQAGQFREAETALDRALAINPRLRDARQLLKQIEGQRR